LLKEKWPKENQIETPLNFNWESHCWYNFQTSLRG